jgi:hypothetical protein
MDDGIARAGQEYFRLIIETGIDFSVAFPSAIVMECKTLGLPNIEWDAHILIGGEARGSVYHDFGVGSEAVPVVGLYHIRARFLLNGKKVYSTYVDWKVSE